MIRNFFAWAGNAMNLNVVASVLRALYPQLGKADVDIIPKQAPKKLCNLNTQPFNLSRTKIVTILDITWTPRTRPVGVSC